jgi:hypothetical protein
MIVDTPKDSLVNVLAQVVKHNIYSFARTESTVFIGEKEEIRWQPMAGL